MSSVVYIFCTMAEPLQFSNVCVFLGREVQAGLSAVQTNRVVVGTRVRPVRGGREESKSSATGRTSQPGHVFSEGAGAEPGFGKL